MFRDEAGDMLVEGTSYKLMCTCETMRRTKPATLRLAFFDVFSVQLGDNIFSIDHALFNHANHALLRRAETL